MLADEIVEGLELLARLEPQPYVQSVKLFVQRMNMASRFNLKDNVVRAVTNLLATKATTLEAYMDFARRPARHLWVEFPAKSRMDHLAALGIDPVGLQPSRIGMLIDDHPDYPDDLLCGRALVAWRHVNSPLAECGYTELVWDFRSDWQDWRTEAEIKHQLAEAGSRKSSIAYLHKASKPDIEAYCRITSRFNLGPAWVHEEAIPGMMAGWTESQMKRFVEGANSDATSEASMTMAILLMFNIQKALDYEEVTFDKLNRERKKKKKLPLYSYKNVGFYLSPAKRRSYVASGMTVNQGVVLQRVVGHPRHRFSAKRNRRELIWIEPYTRGDSQYGLGPSITHTKTVRL